MREARFHPLQNNSYPETNFGYSMLLPSFDFVPLRSGNNKHSLSEAERNRRANKHAKQPHNVKHFSMIQRPSQRVAVFIDTQNMYHSAKHLYGSRVNFPALVEAAVGNRELVRAIAYVAKSKTGEETAFFEALTSNGIELKVKDVQEFASGEKKADWDVGMAVDAMAISSRVDVVVIVTGDGDFIPLVQYLKANGIVCEAVAFGSSTNNQLREVVDHFLDLSENPTQFLLHSRHRLPPVATPKVKPSSSPRARVLSKEEADAIEEVTSFEPLDLQLDLPPVAPNLKPPAPDLKSPRGRKPPVSSTLPFEDSETDMPSPKGRNIRVTF